MKSYGTQKQENLLNTDYGRIEILKSSDKALSLHRLNTDYGRIEIHLGV